MVLGELPDLPVADQIGTAVADMSDDGLVAMHEQRNASGPHPRQLRMLAAGAEHRGASAFDGLPQRAGERRFRQRGLRGERIVDAQFRGDQFLFDGLDRQPAGGLAARVPAHPVADDVEADVLVDEEAVLVVIALHADVGAGRAAVPRHGEQLYTAFRLRESVVCAAASSSRACSSATSVAFPESRRASSCTRSSPSTGATRLWVRPFTTSFSTVRCLPAKTAICGRCVMQMICRRRATAARALPTASAVAPPMPASTSSNR